MQRSTNHTDNKESECNTRNIDNTRFNIMNAKSIIGLLLLLNYNSMVEAQLKRPYDCGPVLKKKSIKTFERLSRYLGIEAGTVFADVGASSGYYNGAMGVYLDSVTFYIQDIDEACLNKENLKKVLKYYSKFRKGEITDTNDFNIVIGTTTKTNLPENTFDVIYSNATYHVLDDPDAVVSDLYKSLKEEGTLSFRDGFVHDGSEKFCDDKDCGSPLAQHEDFIETMTRNGFVLIDETDEFGYPVYKFKKEG